MSIIGISKEIEDSSTGASIGFHVIEYSCADQRGGVCTAVVGGYFNQAAYTSSKNSISRTTVTISGVPSRGSDSLDWMYSQLVAATESSATTSSTTSPYVAATSTIYSGGTLVSA